MHKSKSSVDKHVAKLLRNISDPKEVGESTEWQSIEK